MTYQEECRLRAQMLLDAADGVEFEENFDGDWNQIHKPRFDHDLSFYRRKPKKVRHEMVVVWFKWNSGSVIFHACETQRQADVFVANSDGEELKRETVFVEVEE